MSNPWIEVCTRNIQASENLWDRQSSIGPCCGCLKCPAAWRKSLSYQYRLTGPIHLTSGISIHQAIPAIRKRFLQRGFIALKRSYCPVALLHRPTHTIMKVSSRSMYTPTPIREWVDRSVISFNKVDVIERFLNALTANCKYVSRTS